LRTAACILILISFTIALSRAQEQTQTAPTTSAGAQKPSNSEGKVPATASASVEDAAALARKYIELWNTGDKAAINSFPDFIMHNHGGRAIVDHLMLERVVSNWRRSMPDLKFTIDDTVVQNDKAVLRVTLRGTYKERLFPESGDPQNPPRLVRATGLIVFQAVDGKIREIWQELDESILRVQMGGQWKTRQELDAESSKSKKP